MPYPCGYAPEGIKQFISPKNSDFFGFLIVSKEYIATKTF